MFATTALSLGSVQLINYCPEPVLYSWRIDSTNTTYGEGVNSGETYSMPFSEAQPQDPSANHTLSFDVWPAYNSDKKMRSVRRDLLAPRQSEPDPLEFGFKFLIWDVTVTEQGVAYSFEDQATDPFPEWGWTWKLASGDEACAPCTALGCAAEGCSPQEDVVMEFCGDGNNPPSLWHTSSLNQSPTSIAAPTSSPTVISSISIPLESATATPLAPSATRTYPQYTTTTTSATASIIAGSLYPGPSGSGAVFPSGGGYNYQPSPLPAAFTGAASKLQESYIGAFALAAGLMMF